MSKKSVQELIRESRLSVPKIAKATGIPAPTIYGWLSRGSKASYEDSLKVLAFINENQPGKNSEIEGIISVLIDRVGELLAWKNGTSLTVEREKMQKDAEYLSSSKK